MISFFSFNLKKGLVEKKMMDKKKKIVIAIIIIVGIGLFGYSQYVSILTIEASIIKSTPINENDESNSEYNLNIEFNNPSLLPLTAGETEFMLVADKKRIGDGTLDPFVLLGMSKTMVNGTFIVYDDPDSKDNPSVTLSGITKYDLFFTTIDIPFIHYPTESQINEFINRN